MAITLTIPNLPQRWGNLGIMCIIEVKHVLNPFKLKLPQL